MAAALNIGKNLSYGNRLWVFYIVNDRLVAQELKYKL